MEKTYTWEIVIEVDLQSHEIAEKCSLILDLKYLVLIVNTREDV